MSVVQTTSKAVASATEAAAAATRHPLRQKRRTLFHWPQGHGENIWVFTHRRSEQVIYSFQDTLDGHHDLKQLPFNGKKTKPAKLRKDYWYPMAKIAFPAGSGIVGRSVFQKLRELKHLHEVAWPTEMLFKTPSEYSKDDHKKKAELAAQGRETWKPVRTKKQRGAALNAQKKNAIADMAVVLAGQGPGNQLLRTNKKGQQSLTPVQVTWSNELDRNYAESWTGNVQHDVVEEPSLLTRIGEKRAALEAEHALGAAEGQSTVSVA